MTSLTENGGSNKSLPKRSRRPGPWLAALGAFLTLWIAPPSPADPFEIEKFVPEMKTKNYEDNKVRHPAFWADSGVQYCLVTNRRNLVDWAAEILDVKPKNAIETLIKINVLQNAGLDRQAAETVRLLKKFYPDPADPIARETAHTILRDVWDRSRAVHTAVAVCETFPQYISGMYHHRFSQIFDQLREEGWSDAQREKWLIKLESQVSRELIYWDRPQLDHPGGILILTRYRMQTSDEARRKIFTQLEQDIEKHSDDAVKAYYFLLLWEETFREDKHRNRKMVWFAQTSRPQRYQDAYAFADLLYRWYRSGRFLSTEPARIMLQRAKTLFEKAEQTSATAKESDALAAAKRKWYKSAIEELQKKYDSHFRPTSPPAVNIALPSTSTANKSAPDNKKEAADKNDPEYWLRQASTLWQTLRQKDNEESPKQAEQTEQIEYAFKKGLELTDPASWPTDSGKRRKYEILRGQLFIHYMNFLEVSKQDYGEIGRACLKELKIAPHNSQTPTTAAMILSYDYVSPWVDWNDPAIWKWLRGKTYWGSFEEKLLDTMAREISQTVTTLPPPNHEAPKAIYAFIKHLETLAIAKDADLSRMKFCIKILSDPQSPLDIQPNNKRLIPLLEHWSQRKELYEHDRQYVGNQLLHAYLMENRIDKADTFIKSLKNDISQDRAMFLEIARIAAEKGEKDIAMRNWRRSANCALKDKKQLELNRLLRQHGLGDEIDNYYNEVKKKLPRFLPIEEKKTQNHT